MTGNAPVIPTENFRARVGELINRMPRESVVEEGVETLGAPIGVPRDALNELQRLTNIQEGLTLNQWQLLRTDIREGLQSGTLMPGVGNRFRTELLSAVDGMIDDAVNSGSAPQGLREGIRRFHQQYRARAGEFEANVIERLARSDRFANFIEPEEVVEYVVRPGKPERIRRVMNLLPNDVRDNVRRLAMEDILTSAVRTDPNDVTSVIFSGAPFRDMLRNKWGENQLRAVFGQDAADQLLRFADVQAFLAEKGQMIGGLAVANIALHPWKNLPRQVQFRLLERGMTNPSFVRWMTEGARAPTVRAASDSIARLTAMAQMILEDEVQEKQPQENSGAQGAK
jgi:hypothetical protein